MESSGDAAGARALLLRAVQSSPHDAAALTRYAEFLERHADPAARQTYSQLIAALQAANNSTAAAEASHRLALLDLLAGDQQAAVRDGAKSLGAGHSQAPSATINIPGPIRSFARMAAISPEVLPEEVLPALARNVVTNGYEASHSNEALEQTEYLKLVHRYLSQARELDKLAGADKIIKIESCDSPSVAELIRVLGFRMHGGCGSEVVLETVNAARAFLTTDSGFPVNKLEEALRTNRPFTYDYHPAVVPVLVSSEYWLGGAKESTDFLENFIGDPATCRLYLGLSKLDTETADALRKATTYTHLKAYAHVLDFFGGMFEIRDGKAVTPGGAKSAAVWSELVGVSTDKGPEFFDKLLGKDDGWLCSLYDAIARIHGPLRDYLTDPVRMRRFYTAVRGRITSPGPARPVFRSNTDMMLLTTRLRLDADGKPHIPGNLDVWKDLFVKNPQGRYDGKLTRLATTWKDSDDVLEALFALCRKSVENEPLKIFMALTDVDRNRATPLTPETTVRLSHDFRQYGSQYSLFSESRRLSESSITGFLDVAEATNRIHDAGLRSDVAGSFQALMGLWAILVRQGSLPDSKSDAAFAGINNAFLRVVNERELFDASRSGVKLLLGDTTNANEKMVDLLAGASQSDDTETRDQMKQDIHRILEAQRLPSLDTLFQLGAHLEGAEKLSTTNLNKLSARLSEVQIPRSPLTANEKNAMGFGYWTERHLDAERRVNIRLSVERAAGDPAKLKEITAQLAPLLRDTLLAFNYAYYAPPGAQILYTNPTFVRGHDFVGGEGQSRTWAPTEMYGTGWPSNGGGRLVGSLSSLPYALAEAEQNFLVPTQTQALIWGDLVPQMILSAKIPRWWNVSPSQVHWVGLHLQYGRELLAESALDADVRTEVTAALALSASPARTNQVRRLLEAGNVKDAAERVTPSELFSVAREMAAKQKPESSCVLAELKQLGETKDVNYAAISRAFGTPKPTLANSYEPEMLNLRTFPTLMGYSSRIMAESWESNTLYWAGLADELSVSPSQLNVRIPEWTQKLVEHIFASHLEDWPAVLKSLRLVGDDVRKHVRADMAVEQKAGLQN
ncbi:MAG TPA: hypothetical protein VG456_12510 [Candidatus Sulfopaludibacter sp.]|jgi:hypothetical protein|nr:hypothetical protein [Candidatus Sulfopaludibacter sp.]